MRLCASLVLLALACSSLPARAQDEAPAPAADDEEARKQAARVAYEAGKTHYAVGEFDQALTRFAEAYKLRSAPLLLFNMGQCHRQLKNHERAVFFLEGYLRDATPDDANREVAAELLVDEQKALQMERAAAEVEAAAAAANAAKATAEAEAAAESSSSTPTGSESNVAAVAEDAPIWTQWWLWTGVAAGVVVVAAAAGTTAAVLALSDDGLPDSSLGTVDLRGGT